VSLEGGEPGGGEGGGEGGQVAGEGNEVEDVQVRVKAISGRPGDLDGFDGV
jgi:hypothetical protein